MSLFRYLRESESRQIRSNHPVPIGQTGNEFTEHKRRCRESVKQKQHRRTRVASCTIENFDSVCFDLMNGCHRYNDFGKNKAHENPPHATWSVCLWAAIHRLSFQ